MKREMRKLNRVKYAYSEEEVSRLVREGYVPVDPEQGTSGADGAGQTAALTQGQDGADGAGQVADSGGQKTKRGTGKK